MKNNIKEKHKKYEFIQNQPIRIKISNLVPYEHHPFKVCVDEKLKMLAEHMGEVGLLEAIIVRKTNRDGIYEILSGHRRVEAAKLLGWTKINARIIAADDMEAVEIVIKSNLFQTRKTLPSEKARSYKRRYDDLISERERLSHGETQEQSLLSDAIAKEFGESSSNVYRYLRLNHLIDDILDLVDNGEIKILTAVDLSYLTKSQQKMVYDYFFVDEKAVLKPEYIKQMRSCGLGLSVEKIDEITAEDLT